MIDAPRTCSEAISCDESDQWQKAMDEEIRALRENDTYELILAPKGKKIVAGRWAYTVKEDEDDRKLYKARYVAKGFSQTAVIDYNETFSPLHEFPLFGFQLSW